MTSRGWFWTTISGTLLIVAALWGFTYGFDIYGMYRDAHGRELPVYGLDATRTDDRNAKFLLSQYYVPENFDGLVLGSSGMSNWRVGRAGGVNFYNESVTSGTSVEEGFLAKQALQRGHYRVVILELFPFMTGSHVYLESLDKAKTGDAFGTINSVESHLGMLMVRANIRTNPFSPDGAGKDLPKKGPIEEDLPVPLDSIDPVAWDAYRKLVLELQRDGALVVYVVPPVYRPAYLKHKDEMDQYVAKAKASFPQAPLVDLNDEAYAAITSDPSKFSDPEHVTAHGAAVLTRIVGGRIADLLNQK